MTTITLPWPPAVNNLFINAGKRRIKSERYKAWQTEAGWELLRQRPEAVVGRFGVTITAHAPDNRVRDLDGLFKAPLDLLTTHGVIEDDHLARSLHIIWSDAAPCKPGFVIVTITPEAPPALAGAA